MIQGAARARRGVFFAAVLLMLAMPLPGAGEQDRPSFRSGTRLIEVSVVVTTRANKPITGLTADDFQIFDDGKPQKVEVFSFETGATAGSAPARPIGPTREFSNDVGDLRGGVTIILFDQLNTSGSVAMYARQHLIRFL